MTRMREAIWDDIERSHRRVLIFLFGAGLSGLLTDRGGALTL